MLGRGLQGSYNAFSSKRGIHFPRGEVVVFSVWYVDCIVSKLVTSFLTWLCHSCAQIMYAFLMAPDTLPRSYTNWSASYSLLFFFLPYPVL